MTANLTQEDYESMIDELRQAQELLGQAVELMKGVANATKDEHAKMYVIAPIAIHADAGNDWYSPYDSNLTEWIEELEGEAAGAPSEDDEIELCEACGVPLDENGDCLNCMANYGSSQLAEDSSNFYHSQGL